MSNLIPHPFKIEWDCLIKELNAGQQYIFKFSNGFGASVVSHQFSYGYAEGLWELAVLTFSSDDITNFNLTYDTEITDDVIGHLSVDDVRNLLERICRL